LDHMAIPKAAECLHNQEYRTFTTARESAENDPLRTFAAALATILTIRAVL